MAKKANLGIAIIAKNSEKTIGACLDSIVPYVKQVVVCVDEATTDRTAQVARNRGATVYKGLKVSEPHECPYHGKIKVQHFANARQASFARLDKSLTFHMWMDADDILKGGDKLAAYLDSLPQEVTGVWLPYHYSTAGKDGLTSTLFDRERIIRPSIPFEWQYRVHEILVPIGCTIESLNWVRTDDIAIYHQGEGHDTQGSAKRNITLLEIDLEENSEDMRAWFYLGNQYFALADYVTSAECFEKSTKSNNPYQLWQSYIYLSMSYEKLGKMDESRGAAFKALDVQPSHPEPYYRLAACYMLMNDVGRTEFWTQLGDKMKDPPPFVFRNPLDRPYNARLILAQAYAVSGQNSKAKRQLEIAARSIQTPQIMEGIVYHTRMEEDAKVADAYVRVLQDYPDLTVIPDNVKRFGRVRDVVIPRIISKRPNTQPRVIFYCGQSLEPWCPETLNTTGIGGSETAVVHIAKLFADSGWKVDVYNNPDCMEGIYDGVGYWGLNRLMVGESADVLVAWRQPAFIQLKDQLSFKQIYLWCHDLNKGPEVRDDMAKFDRVLGVSQWHANYLSQVYSLTNTGYVPNGLDLSRFDNPPGKKVPFRCVYASSQDRGLLTLLSLWPQFTAVEPSTELHVAYGWENFDKYIAMGHTQLAQLKEQIMELMGNLKGVVWRGRMSQSDLARLYQESYCWLYPTSYLEVSCISAMEAMAGGCVPVTSAAGALPETIGEAGLVIPGNTYSPAWKEFWVNCAKAALLAPDVRIPMASKGIERAKEFTWESSFRNYWLPLVSSSLPVKEEVMA